MFPPAAVTDKQTVPDEEAAATQVVDEGMQLSAVDEDRKLVSSPHETNKLQINTDDLCTQVFAAAAVQVVVVVTARQHSVILAMMDSVLPTVHPTVCHTLVSCQNDSRYDHAVFTGG